MQQEVIPETPIKAPKPRSTTTAPPPPPPTTTTTVSPFQASDLIMAKGTSSSGISRPDSDFDHKVNLQRSSITEDQNQSDELLRRLCVECLLRGCLGCSWTAVNRGGPAKSCDNCAERKIACSGKLYDILQLCPPILPHGYPNFDAPYPVGNQGNPRCRAFELMGRVAVHEKFNIFQWESLQTDLLEWVYSFNAEVARFKEIQDKHGSDSRLLLDLSSALDKIGRNLGELRDGQAELLAAQQEHSVIVAESAAFRLFKDFHETPEVIIWPYIEDRMSRSVRDALCRLGLSSALANNMRKKEMEATTAAGATRLSQNTASTSSPSGQKRIHEEMPGRPDKRTRFDNASGGDSPMTNNCSSATEIFRNGYNTVRLDDTTQNKVEGDSSTASYATGENTIMQEALRKVGLGHIARGVTEGGVHSVLSNSDEEGEIFHE